MPERSGVLYKGAWRAAVLMGLAVLPVLAVLDTPFLVNWDDTFIVDENPLIAKGWAGFRVLLSGKLEHGHMQLAYLSAALDHMVFGDWAGGYRLVNALLHGCSALLVYRIALDLGVKREGVAFLAAALFAVHPTTVETVVWVIQRNNALAQFFCLAAVSVYVGRAPDAPGWRRTALAALLVTLAQFSKTSAVATWGAFAACELLLFRDAAWRRGVRAAVLLVPCLFGAAMGAAAHAEQFVAPIGGNTAIGRIAGALYVQGRAWLLVLWPAGLSAFYHVPPEPGIVNLPTAAGVLIPLGFVGLYRWAGLEWRRGLLLAAWAVGSLAPNMNPFMAISFVLQDRYVYLALPAMCLLIAEVLGAAAEWLEVMTRTRWTTWAVAGLAALLASVGVAHAMDWRSEPRLFAAAAAEQPQSAFGRSHLATNLYFNEQRFFGKDAPGTTEAMRRHAAFLREEVARVLGVVPASPNLSRLMLERCVREHALARACDDLERTVYPLRYLTEEAQVRLRLGDAAGARELYRRVWEGREERAVEQGAKLEAVSFLAFDAFKNGRVDDGLRYADGGLKLQPDHALLLTNRLLALEGAGRTEEARREATRLLKDSNVGPTARAVLERLARQRLGPTLQ
jgi:hypothetical protein